MKKFKFSLEKVLVQREIAESLAQKEFVEAQNVMNEERKKLQEMIDMKEATLMERSRLIETSDNWGFKVEQMNFFLTGQELRIKNQSKRLLDAEELVEVKRELLRQAVSEVKVLEKLKEKQSQAHMQEATKTEQAELDELAVLRFSRNENPIKGSREDGV